MGVFFEFDDVDAFTVGTEGRPGERVFYLQARAQRTTRHAEVREAAGGSDRAVPAPRPERPAAS